MRSKDTESAAIKLPSGVGHAQKVRISWAFLLVVPAMQVNTELESKDTHIHTRECMNSTIRDMLGFFCSWRNDILNWDMFCDLWQLQPRVSPFDCCHTINILSLYLPRDEQF